MADGEETLSHVSHSDGGKHLVTVASGYAMRRMLKEVISRVHNGQIRKGIRVSFRENGKPMPYLAHGQSLRLDWKLRAGAIVRRETAAGSLTRALLGLVRTLPSAGGGGGGRIGPPIYLGNLQTWGKNSNGNGKAWTRSFRWSLKIWPWGHLWRHRSGQTQNVWHFPFIAFPPQNSENKRISSRWIDMFRVCDISEHRP